MIHNYFHKKILQSQISQTIYNKLIIIPSILNFMRKGKVYIFGKKKKSTDS